MSNQSIADKAHPAICRECLADGKPPWHSPIESGEWGLCSEHVNLILEAGAR